MGVVLRSVVVCSLVALAGACATPGVNVVSWEPSPLLEPQGADRMVLVDGEGRASAKRIVADLFRDAARGSYFHVEDRGPSGVKLTLAGKHATVDGSATAPRPTELWVRIDVLAWSFEQTTLVIDDGDDDGGTHEVPGVRGHADLQYSIANAAGDVIIREREVRGVADLEAENDGRLDDRRGEEAAITAARGAVATIIAELSPQRQTGTYRFDTGDNGQKRILEDDTATLANRERRLRRYLKKNDANAIAHHNLAIILAAQGRFEDALVEHDRAIAIVNRPGFADARGETARHLTMWVRMFGPRPVVEATVPAAAQPVEGGVAASPVPASAPPPAP